MQEPTRVRAMAVAFAALLLLHCKNEPAGEAGASAPENPCTAEHTKVEEQGFCIKLPAGWKLHSQTPSPHGSGTEVRFDDATGYALGVTVNPTGLFPDDITQTVGRSPGSTQNSGEFLDGKGKWVVSEGGGTAVASVYVKAAKGGTYSCGVSSTPDRVKALVETCKTIVPL